MTTDCFYCLVTRERLAINGILIAVVGLLKIFMLHMLLMCIKLQLIYCLF